jgi:hypothetical protein
MPHVDRSGSPYRLRYIPGFQRGREQDHGIGRPSGRLNRYDSRSVGQGSEEYALAINQRGYRSADAGRAHWTSAQPVWKVGAVLR